MNEESGKHEEKIDLLDTFVQSHHSFENKDVARIRVWNKTLK